MDENKDLPKQGHKNIQLRLNNIENSRKTLSKIIRMFNENSMSDNKYRGLVYGMDKLLKYWTLEKDLELEKHLTTLEEKIEKLGKV